MVNSGQNSKEFLTKNSKNLTRESKYLMRDQLGAQNIIEQFMKDNVENQSSTNENLGQIYFDAMWDDRYKDCRLFSLIVLISEFAYSIISLIFTGWDWNRDSLRETRSRNRGPS